MKYLFRFLVRLGIMFWVITVLRLTDSIDIVEMDKMVIVVWLIVLVWSMIADLKYKGN